MIMKQILFSLLLLTSSFVLSQKKLRDSVIVNTELFKIIYSEKLQQPLSIKYNVQCPSGSASRKGLDFYICDSIITSDDKDYNNNIWDKGHLAPAADFNCSRDLMKKTFTYLNCSLQHQDLNRTTWRLLEEYERSLSLKDKIVSVEITCEFSSISKVLPSGATIPDGYYKIIKYDNITETYYFKNEKPSSTDFKKFKK